MWLCRRCGGSSYWLDPESDHICVYCTWVDVGIDRPLPLRTRRTLATSAVCVPVIYDGQVPALAEIYVTAEIQGPRQGKRQSTLFMRCPMCGVGRTLPFKVDAPKRAQIRRWHWMCRNRHVITVTGNEDGLPEYWHEGVEAAIS